ncbi:hypothetical protein HRI_002434600 [Hibiscus trionum]|uniref:Uncharacterized protein n=1 Tax=Hibiscus trionum TaxID=183268 RepID=A0A9W7I3W2_HIBTR|nr:hypothetical protein HRI_002434600 [Hibiscus trionum]
MANPLNKPLSTSFLFSIILSFFNQTKQDNPCSYSCYPPPTGPGGSTGTGTVTQTPPVSYPPPSQTGALYPSPTGNLPYFPPPPPYGSSLYGHPLLTLSCLISHTTTGNFLPKRMIGRRQKKRALENHS